MKLDSSEGDPGDRGTEVDRRRDERKNQKYGQQGVKGENPLSAKTEKKEKMSGMPMTWTKAVRKAKKRMETVYRGCSLATSIAIHKKDRAEDH